MAESIIHMNYVRRIVEYITSIPEDFAAQLLTTDLPESQFRPIPTLDGYIPDVVYKSRWGIIIGEAKTIHDVDNDHTQRQLQSYIDEVRCHNGKRHIVLCSSMVNFAYLNNMIIRRKMREDLSDITFHILDSYNKVAVI